MHIQHRTFCSSFFFTVVQGILNLPPLCGSTSKRNLFWLSSQRSRGGGGAVTRTLVVRPIKKLIFCSSSIIVLVYLLYTLKVYRSFPTKLFFCGFPWLSLLFCIYLSVWWMSNYLSSFIGDYTLISFFHVQCLVILANVNL